MAQKETDQVTATSASRADKVESSKRGSSQQRERLAFITQCLQVHSSVAVLRVLVNLQV